jgi:DNA-binding NarL/FixJ family response regulator
MDGSVKQNIFLYSGYTPRSTALAERVEKACKNCVSVVLIEDVSHILEKRIQDTETIVVLDLPNIKQSAIQTVGSVKKRSDDIKILAIHIYTTKLLISPLIKAGIHGYMMYEPTISEIRDALHAVTHGELYLPVDIQG